VRKRESFNLKDDDITNKNSTAMATKTRDEKQALSKAL